MCSTKQNDDNVQVDLKIDDKTDISFIFDEECGSFSFAMNGDRDCGIDGFESAIEVDMKNIKQLRKFLSTALSIVKEIELLIPHDKSEEDE